MDSSKLNRHFTFQLCGDSYVWYPISTVMFHIRETGEKEHVYKIEHKQEKLYVTIANGKCIMIDDMQTLSSRLRYPASKYKSGYAQQV